MSPGGQFPLSRDTLMKSSASSAALPPHARGAGSPLGPVARAMSDPPHVRGAHTGVTIGFAGQGVDPR